MKDFRTLNVWKKSHELTLEIYSAISHNPLRVKGKAKLSLVILSDRRQSLISEEGVEGYPSWRHPSTQQEYS